MFRILLIDDDLLFLEGLKYLLNELRSDIEFDEAKSLSEALQLMNEKNYDLITLDYFFHNSEKQGFDLIKEIYSQANDSKMVMISGVDLLENKNITIKNLTQLGISGFVPKSADHRILIDSLKLILSGEEYFPSSLINRAFNCAQKRAKRYGLHRLTARQLQILKLAAEGIPNKTIADDLNVSVGTIKAHLSAIYQLLGVKNRTQAAHIIKGYAPAEM